MFHFISVPISVPHKTIEVVEMDTYIIPKDTTVIFNLDSVLLEEDVWGPDAKLFNPQRWFDDSDDLKRFPGFIPFSGGKLAT